MSRDVLLDGLLWIVKLPNPRLLISTRVSMQGILTPSLFKGYNIYYSHDTNAAGTGSYSWVNLVVPKKLAAYFSAISGRKFDHLSSGQKWFQRPYFPLIGGIFLLRSGLRVRKMPLALKIALFLPLVLGTSSTQNENLRPLLNRNIPLISGKYGL